MSIVPRGYLAEGLPVDYEGLAAAYAMKYGQKAAEQLMEAIPNMNTRDLMATIAEVGGAADEYDNMQKRERNTYKRAGMVYDNGTLVRGE